MESKLDLRQRAKLEFKKFLVYFAYLALFFVRLFSTEI